MSGLSNHRWIKKEIQGERFFECADCRTRDFGPVPGDEKVPIGGR